MNYETQGSDPFLNDEPADLHINRFLVSLKLDLDLKASDDLINKPDHQDLAAKMKCLVNQAFQFRQQPILKIIQHCDHFKQPKQPKQQSTLSLELSSNNSSPRKKRSDSVQQSRKSNKKHTLSAPKKKKLEDAVSPAFNRFQSKKKSQFSSQAGSNIELESTFKPMQRRDRSINVTTTIQVQAAEYQVNEIRLLRQIKQKKNQTYANQQQLQELEVRNQNQNIRNSSQKRNSCSSSNMSTPKSILKNPSLNGSGLDIRLNSCQSRLSVSSLNISQISQQSPSKSKGSKRKVKFCLTRKQAKRENIKC